MFCIEGDMFENESDIEDPSVWIAVSWQPELQKISRYNAVAQYSVKFIVPGHGRMFQVTEDYLKLLKNTSLSDLSNYISK